MKPIYDSVKAYAKSKPKRFHTPLHAGKSANYLSCAKYDVTELEVTDNLFKPKNAIKKSLQLLCHCYKSKASFMLTSGTSTAIFCMLYAVKCLGKSIIIQRSSHKSVYNALEVLGIEPIFLQSKFSDGLENAIDLNTLEQLLKDNSNSIGVLITSPDYYGRVQEIEKIKSITGKYNKLLLVDSAHGAHFVFSSRFDNSVQKNADIYCTSPHKTLPVLTGGSFLHVNNEMFVDRVREAVEIFHSTSPSFLTLASLDYAREYADNNRRKYDDWFSIMQRFKIKIENIGGNIVANNDFTRLVIDSTAWGFAPDEFARLLQERNIYAEFYDFKRIVFIIGLPHSIRDLNRLFRTIKGIVKSKKPTQEVTEIVFPLIPTRKVSYLQAFSAQPQRVLLENAEGRIAARNVGFYPPSYPLIVAGEVYSHEIINFLKTFESNTFGVDKGRVFVLQ